MKINDYQAMEMTQLTRGIVSVLNYSRPPVSDRAKCQVEVVAYETLDHNGSEFFLIRI